MFGIKSYVLSLLVVLMGSMDCLTTVVGTLYFETTELNPLIADLVHSNLPAFVVIKLIVSLGVGAIFVWAQRILRGGLKREEKSFKLAQRALIAAYTGITLFLAAAVLNNIIVLLQTYMA